MSTTARPPPVTTTRLKQIAQEACDSTLTNASSYVHSSTESWNASIINKILTSLLASAQTSTGTTAQYKYAVNSTIIQHLSVPSSSSTGTATTGTSTSTGTGTGTGEDPEAEQNGQTVSPPNTPPAAGGSAGPPGSVAPEKGRRGMHSATGAYWNSETDGMFSYKYEGGERKGLDVVVSVIWVAV